MITRNQHRKPVVILMLLFIGAILSAQTVKVPKLTELVKPVTGTNGAEDMVFSFECAAAWGDYNNDGFLDLVTSGAGHNWVKTTVLYKNNGNGKLTKVIHPFPALQNASAVWLDYNNDGNLDLFLTGIDDVGKFTGLFKNLGAEAGYAFEEVFEDEFEPLFNGGGNRSNRYAIAGDYDNDGWVDLYLQGRNEEGTHSLLYKNEKGNGFSLVECPVNGNGPFAQLYGNTAAFGDYDNDGYLDLLTSGYSTIAGRSSTGAYYKNNGNGTFAEPVLVAGGVNGEVAWIDHNNDGYWDFIITGYSFLDGVGWQGDLFENKGNGKFGRLLPSKTKLATTQDCSIACGDVNNDGFEDVLYLYSHPNALYLNNFGNQTFTKSDLKYNGQVTYDQTGGMVCLVDFDRDNDLDAFTMGYGGNFLPSLFRNDLGNGIPVNTPPSVPANLKADTSEPGLVKFTWDTSTDDLTPEKAIRYNLYVQKEGSARIMSVLPADLTSGLLKVNENLAPVTTNAYQLSGLENGNYTFGVQAIDNGKLTSKFATAQFMTDGLGINTYPNINPAMYVKEKILYVSSKGKGEINIYNIQGIKIKSLSGDIAPVPLNDLTHGVYIVKIQINNEYIINKIVL